MVAERIHILVAEDDELAATGLEICLKQAGYTVMSATDGAAAIATWEQNEAIRVLVTDLRMPIMDGIELIRRIRARCPDLAVIIVTGTPHDEGVQALQNNSLGHTHVLVKPFRPATLLDTIKTVLDSGAPPCHAPAQS